MGETYPPAAAWGAQGASPLQPELLYICPGHFSSVTESSGHTIYTHLSHMLALWKVNVSQCSDARGDTVPAVRALLEAELYAEPVPADEDAVLMDDTHDDGGIQQAED